MAYEDQTENVIKQRMLNNTPSELDKREGAFIYDSISPVAIELAQSYIELGLILDRPFVDTATGTYLDRKVVEQGLTRKPAVAANGYVDITGQNGAQINEGDKVASVKATYTIKESKTIGATGIETVFVECDQPGSIGNCPVGSINIFPISLPGLTTVTNTAEFNNGYDGETDEELRQRYFDKVRTPPTSGNKYHYRNWTMEVTGVGDAVVKPLANGPGTVKIIIIDSNKTGAEPELIAAVVEHIEEVRPIGAAVTVVSATEVPINVTATITLATGYTLEQVKATIENNLTEYLKTAAFAESYVSYAKIGSTILSSDGVLDYSNLLVNGATANIPVTDEQVAVIGTVTVS